MCQVDIVFDDGQDTTGFKRGIVVTSAHTNEARKKSFGFVMLLKISQQKSLIHSIAVKIEENWKENFSHFCVEQIIVKVACTTT